MIKAARFLNPKADVVFKKVFGNHEHLLRSFLNAMIPLPEGRIIENVTYLTPEQVPVEGIEKGREEGREEGIAEGERKKALETAKKLRLMGLNMEDIAEIVGISVNELKNIF